MLNFCAVWSVPWNFSFSDFRVELFAWNTDKTNSLWLLCHIIMSPKHWCKCMSSCLCSSVMSWAPVGDHIPSAESFLSSSVILNLSVNLLSCSAGVCTVCKVLALNIKHTHTHTINLYSLLYTFSEWTSLKWSYIHSKWITLKMHCSLALLLHSHQKGLFQTNNAVPCETLHFLQHHLSRSFIGILCVSICVYL